MSLENLKPKEPTKFDQIERWVGFVKNIGLLIGIPVLIVVAINLNESRLESLKEQIKAKDVHIALLQGQSASEVIDEIESWRKIADIQKVRLTLVIDSLRRSEKTSDSLIVTLLSNYESLSSRIVSLSRKVDVVADNEGILRQDLVELCAILSDYMVKYSIDDNLHESCLSKY